MLAKLPHFVGFVERIHCSIWIPGISFFSTYNLSNNVSTKEANVDGRPIPFFSNSRTKVASVKRGEAFERLGDAVNEFQRIRESFCIFEKRSQSV
jgi:hypothetical protein